MNIEKEKEFYEKVKSNHVEEAMTILAECSDKEDEFAKLCELGAIAAAVGSSGTGGACFFIDMLKVEAHHDKLLKLLKVFVKGNSERMVSYLLDKGVNPFIEIEGGLVFDLVTNEKMLDVFVEKYIGMTSEQQNILEAHRIGLYISA